MNLKFIFKRVGNVVQQTSYSDVSKIISSRAKDSHKGDNGKVLVVAGSEDYAGAAALAGLGANAALRAGVDLVEVAAPEKVAYAVNIISPDLISRKMSGKFFAQRHLNKVLALSKGFDVVLLGPGIGKRKETSEFIRRFLAKVGKPVILDADALGAVKRRKFSGDVLVTPHAEEFKGLFGVDLEGKKLEDTVGEVKGAAASFNCTILLKGAVDVISDGSQVKVNKTGNEGMTVGGTGDVLAGLCAGLVSVGKVSLYNAACAGAFANGKAGDMLKRDVGFGFTASDLVGKLPQAVGNIDSQKQLKADYLFFKKPWGSFEQFILNRTATVKILEVKPKQILSLQSHKMRDEFWYGIDEGAEVTLGKEKFLLKKGKWAYIPKGTKHRLSGKNKKARVLEISLGFFDEEDINRFEDSYGRA